jgi:hypothetical protein
MRVLLKNKLFKNTVDYLTLIMKLLQWVNYYKTDSDIATKLGMNHL